MIYLSSDILFYRLALSTLFSFLSSACNSHIRGHKVVLVLMMEMLSPIFKSFSAHSFLSDPVCPSTQMRINLLFLQSFVGKPYHIRTDNWRAEHFDGCLTVQKISYVLILVSSIEVEMPLERFLGTYPWL